MLLKQTISSVAKTDVTRDPALETGLDQAQLYAHGIDDVRRFSRRKWTDHNTHDPGITILELLCYALTDLSYRAQFPLADLLAIPTDNAENMATQFYTAGQVLPCKPVTAIDYRKLLIDLKGVRNAWVSPSPMQYFADTIEKKLRHDDPGTAGIRQVDLRGLYQVRIEHMDDVKTDAQRQQLNQEAMALLMANRNLCEDFVPVEMVRRQFYSLCAELELTSAADPVEVAAQVSFRVDQYLAPPLYNYDLEEMLSKKHKDGSDYTFEEIFDGPRLTNGFLDEDEVANADLRSEIRLSDVIRVIMDIEGVLAVRDIVVNALKTDDDGSLVEPIEAIEPADKWRLQVPAGRQPRLWSRVGRLVLYKRSLPQPADPEEVVVRLAAIKQQQRPRLEREKAEEVPIPLGRNRNTASYHSFQHEFPSVYGLSDSGLPSIPDAIRRAIRIAQQMQLKGFLLFFDQVMANYFAQLSQVGKLFSREASTEVQTYYSQLVRSIPDHAALYTDPIVNSAQLPPLETDVEATERRNRFLDHLLARVAEDFHHYVSIMRSTFGATPESMTELKSVFLKDSPDLGAERGLTFNHALTRPEDVWDSLKVSGLERRLARLLGIKDSSRRSLSAAFEGNQGEGMHVVENILLRPRDIDAPFLPICVDPACTDCTDDDPYSYRLHFILPAYAGRFRNMDFRRFVEDTIRLETPAHLLPKICWVDVDQMTEFEGVYRSWLLSRGDDNAADLNQKLQALIDTLFQKMKNVYPKSKLHDCGSDDQSPFILGRSQLGSTE